MGQHAQELAHLLHAHWLALPVLALHHPHRRAARVARMQPDIHPAIGAMRLRPCLETGLGEQRLHHRLEPAPLDGGKNFGTPARQAVVGGNRGGRVGTGRGGRKRGFGVVVFQNAAGGGLIAGGGGAWVSRGAWHRRDRWRGLRGLALAAPQVQRHQQQTRTQQHNPRKP